MDFLPEDFIERRVQRRTNVICLGLFGVVLIGVVGAYGVTRTQLHVALQERERIASAYEDAARRLAQLDELQEQKKSLVRKARLTATLIEPVPRSNLLAALVNRLPEAASMAELKLTSTKTGRRRNAGSDSSALAKAQARAKSGKKGQPGAAGAFPEPVDHYRVDLELVGLAPTDIQVAEYITKLARCSLLQSVDLVFSEERRVTEVAMRRFKIDMVLSPDADIRDIEPVKLARED
jgi:Tfp pilus assembly protein PilN